MSAAGLREALPADDAFSFGVLETMRAQGGSVPLMPWHMARFRRSADPELSVLERIQAQAMEIARQTTDWPHGARVRLRYGVIAGERVWDFSVVPLEAQSPWQRGVVLSLCRTPVTAEASHSPFVGISGTGGLSETRHGSAPDSSRGCKLLQRDLYHRAEKELGPLPEGLGSGLFHEGLLLDADAHVIEGLRTNLLVWRSGHWCTPSLRSCGVRGVMLDWLAGRAEIREDDLQIEDIEQAGELAVCNAVRGVVPVVQFSVGGTAPFTAGRLLSPGPATRSLQMLIADTLW